MDNSIVISTPPHVKSKRTTRSIMIDVLIALAPAAVCGIVYFLLDALVLEITCVAFAVAAEFVYYFIAKGGLNVRFDSQATRACAKKIRQLRKSLKAELAAGGDAEEINARYFADIKAESEKLSSLRAELRKAAFSKSGKVCRSWARQFDFTSVVTGLILALILPPSVRWYEAAIGSVFAIVIVKMVFGGTGRNIANPAAVGRVFMFISFATIMNTYSAAYFGAIDGSTLSTSATYLSGSLIAENASVGAMSLLDLFLGSGLSGCIGETCKLALIAGYIYLVARGVIKWWQPLLVLAVTGIMTVMLNGFDFEFFLPSILSGGIMFGAIFMATDYVTSPKGVYAQIVYYAIFGILTAVLRHFTHVEVVSFVIIIMNLIVPLLDRYIRRKPFGYKREKKAKNKEDGAK